MYHFLHLFHLLTKPLPWLEIYLDPLSSKFWVYHYLYVRSLKMVRIVNYNLDEKIDRAVLAPFRLGQDHK